MTDNEDLIEPFWSPIPDGFYHAKFIGTKYQKTVHGLLLRSDFKLRTIEESVGTILDIDSYWMGGKIVSGLTMIDDLPDINIDDYIGLNYLVNVKNGKVCRCELVRSSQELIDMLIG